LRHWPVVESRPTTTRILIATGWLLSSAVLAVYVPNIAVAINYLGAVANLLVFILPGLSLYVIQFDCRLHERLAKECKLLANPPVLLMVSVAFIAYGVALFGYSLSLSIVKIFDHQSDFTARRMLIY